MKDILLNIGAGKVDLRKYKKQYGFIIHVDRSYSEGLSIADAEECYANIFEGVYCDFHTPQQIFVKSDIFEFVDTFKFKFDVIKAERIFEHMEYVSGEIGRLLEGLNVLTNSKATLEIVVPNAYKLAKLLIAYENGPHLSMIAATNHKLIINTEFCNEQSSPHLSIWTPKLAKEYIESEGTWKVKTINDEYCFAGRDIYMKIVCEKTEREE